MKIVLTGNYSSCIHRLLVLIVASIFSSSLIAASSPYAETVIINGKVITADSNDPSQVTIAQAIAIQGNKILEVGTNAQIQALVADWTEVIDAKGNTITPGYIDTHNHIYESATGFSLGGETPYPIYLNSVLMPKPQRYCLLM